MLAWFVFFTCRCVAQTTFYDLNSIQKIEIFFSQANWDYQLDSSKYGADGYVFADSVRINGVVFDSAAVKYKGNSSYDSTYAKNPLHIELDGAINQSYQGITDIKLGNGYADPSVIREVLAYDILKNYMDCPRSNFAQLYINGNYTGLYSNDESINKDFCSTHFYSSKNTFFKCNPVVIPGPTTKSNLRYIPLADSSAYFNFYELKSTYGWNDLVSLCDTVTNFPSAISNSLDMDRAIWMLAFNTILVNLDSYTGVFCQNYYLYKDNTNRFNPVVWDLNMAFGGFPFVGSGNSSLGSLTVTNMQQLSPTFHASDPYWPLINAVMNNPLWKKMFIAHAKTIYNENFATSGYLVTASQLQALIDTAVQSDNNAFFSYAQFQTGLTADQIVGSYTVPGISNLMGARATYLQSNADFMLVPPVISAVTPGNLSPLFNTTVDITAQVTNANVVYLGYRYDLTSKFERIVMYDDGAHNDGAAGDQQYGVNIPVSSLQIQYYVYAENNDAGIFSPERAEHEFYSLHAVVLLPLPGQVVINEFLAGNTTDTINEYGNYADWIELRNNTSTPIDLFGLYLSDDLTNLSKFAIPVNTVIPGNDYLIVWADEENTTPLYLHSNFKLSVNGEGIWLSDGSFNVIDSITFGAQVNDVSMGRCPNGTGPFVFLSPATFDADNCALNQVPEKHSQAVEINIYPNPFTGTLSLTMKNANPGQTDITIKDVLGKNILRSHQNFEGPVWHTTFDLTPLAPGAYFLEIKTSEDVFTKKIIKHQEPFLH